MQDTEAKQQAELLVSRLKAAGVGITAAESCTGGRIAAAITAIPGSSAVFPGSVVSYCDAVKAKVLGVPEQLLETLGAVSAPVAEAMAEGAAAVMKTELALSATGIAGPDGDGSDNPVGTVFLGIHTPEGTRVEKHVFLGDRGTVQKQACGRALEMALEYLQQKA